MKFALVSVLLLATIPAVAQLPEAPKPALDRSEMALLGVDAVVRTLDAYSTRRMLQCSCNRELVLPGFISGHSANMTVFSEGVVVFNWWAAKKLERHHHSRLAHVLIALDIAQDAPGAIHNLFLPVTPISVRSGQLMPLHSLK